MSISTSTLQCYTLKETAALLAVSETTVRRLVHAGSLPVLRPRGRKMIIRATEIEKYLESNAESSDHMRATTPGAMPRKEGETWQDSTGAKGQTAGTRPTRTQAARRLDALLKRPTRAERKP
ncbi:MAG: helix-turn-helix domain-containing protein [Magnetococcales bacterium]|nr:helix-turn-helix domain-containing protein [Magnetococcales bacterium]